MYDVDAYAVHLSVMQWSVVHVYVWLLLMCYTSILNFKDHNLNTYHILLVYMCSTLDLDHDWNIYIMLYFVSRVNNDSITYICKLCVYMEINLLFCSVLFSVRHLLWVAGFWLSKGVNINNQVTTSDCNIWTLSLCYIKHTLNVDPLTYTCKAVSMFTGCYVKTTYFYKLKPIRISNSFTLGWVNMCS